MLLLSFSMSWICFRNAVLNPLYVGKATYSNKEKFGILEDNLKPPPLVHQKADPHRFSQLRSPLTLNIKIFLDGKVLPMPHGFQKCIIC